MVMPSVRVRKLRGAMPYDFKNNREELYVRD